MSQNLIIKHCHERIWASYSYNWPISVGSGTRFSTCCLYESLINMLELRAFRFSLWRVVTSMHVISVLRSKKNGWTG